MGKLAHRACVAALMLTGACERAAIEPSQSLVGATEIPSKNVLSRETIHINTGFGDWGRYDPGLLSHQLRSDGTLTVTIERYQMGAGKYVIEGKETFRLSPKLASLVRQALWRLRPKELRGAERETEIADCPPPPTDNFPDYAVAFIAEGPKPGVEDDHIGVSVLRGARTCDTPQASEARILINNVLKSFPSSKLAAEHAGRVKELEAMFRS